jgi:hypothetical protein
MPWAEARISIDAPIGLVWRVMLDLDAYPAWNPFIVRIDPPALRPAQVGDDLVLHVRWRGGFAVRSRERITRLEPPKPAGPGSCAALEYEFRGPVAALRLVRGRRLQALEQTPGGPTCYRTSERLHGWLAGLVPASALRDGFERHAAALALRARALAHVGLGSGS